MRFSSFLENNNLSQKDVTLCKSKKNTYSNSTDSIVFIRLTKSVEGQDYLVLSHNAAKAYLGKKIRLSKLEASYDEEYGWGIIMPPSFEELDINW